MKMFLFSSDEDTLTGLRLAGVDGCLIRTEEDLLQRLQEVRARQDIAVLLVTRTLSLRFPQDILQMKKDPSLLITEIPDMEHPTVSGDGITRYVRDAIGINV